MAIITEEEDEKTRISPQSNPEKTNPLGPKSSQIDRQPQTHNPFTFWFYFTLAVSIATSILVSLSSLSSSDDPKAWFLSLPPSLRQHYSNGRTVKVQLYPNQSPVEVFVADNGQSGSENIVLVHGLGLSSYAFRGVTKALGSKGVHVVAFDLPGNGFSDKSTLVIDEDKELGFLGRLKEVYDLIQEKGIFWAFDQMVETGQIPYEEIIKIRAPNRKTLKPIELGCEESGRVLGQVIDTMNLAPVHLVLHDSALGLASNWVFENSQSIRSVTLIDTGTSPALPVWILDLPLIREVVLGISLSYQKLVSFCCSKGISVSEMETHRILLKGRNGRKAIVGSLKKLNHSFEIAEWGGLDRIKDIPMLVAWSRDWSKEWTEVGQSVVKALPKAKFVTHSGGRWPQEDAADELASSIAGFVSSQPKSVRQVGEEAIPEHIQKKLDEAKVGNHHHGHGHSHDHGSHDGHDHSHETGYMDAYGLGHGWAA